MPRGFEPVAASFTSPAWGVVLGGVGCGPGHACRAQLAMTADGGAHWSLMRAPAVWLAGSQGSLPQVGQILFADRADGWLYSQGSQHLWVTHDGGASWREITLPGGVQTMAAAAGAVYAVIQGPGGGQLYRSPLGWNSWTRVGTWTRYGPMTGTTLAVSGNSVWFAGHAYLWTTADDVHWARYALRSPGTYYGRPYTLAGISAVSRRPVPGSWRSCGPPRWACTTRA